MEVVAQTDYQDIYRITDGVLLIVNKFIPIKYEGKEYFRVWKSKQRRYNKNCQEWLKVLQSDYYDEYDNITVPNGTVIYQDRPVVLSTNKADYQYQIKTTGESFSGNSTKMIEMLQNIIKAIK